MNNILDSIPAGIYWQDLDGKWLGKNRYMTDRIKLSAKDIIEGKPKYEIVHAGKICIYFLTKAPLYDQDSKNIIGSLGIFVDTTNVLELLTGYLAHEMRTPLAVVNINADNLLVTVNSLQEGIFPDNKLNITKKIISNIKAAVVSGTKIIEKLSGVISA
ncbi:MAG: hypothetical protein ACD_69C00201G0002 [uncultured bacterium]|nr:MAG: hypothetical protein ACD_69C00201G0002 [uncultured bacterium]